MSIVTISHIHVRFNLKIIDKISPSSWEININNEILLSIDLPVCLFTH